MVKQENQIIKTAKTIQLGESPAAPTAPSFTLICVFTSSHECADCVASLVRHQGSEHHEKRDILESVNSEWKRHIELTHKMYTQFVKPPSTSSR